MRWAAVVPGQRVYVLESEELAREFAGFLAAEVDPAEVLPVADPAAELLAWRRSLEELPAADPDRLGLGALPVVGELVDTAATAQLQAVPVDAELPHVSLSAACQRGQHSYCTGRGCQCPQHADQLAACTGTLIRGRFGHDQP